MNLDERKEFLTWLRENRILRYRDSDFEVTFDPIDTVPPVSVPMADDPETNIERYRREVEKTMYWSS